VKARARLLASGVGRTIVDEFVGRAAALECPERALVADLGSGSGETLGRLALARPITGVGIDLSTAAVEHAAHRFPSLTWVVANADRRLPFLDQCVSLVLSLHGRRQPSESARVLAPSGYLLVAVPAPDDLIELRRLIQGEGVERERANAVLAEHEPFFTMIERFSVREQHALDRTSLVDVLRATYRGARASAARRVDALTTLDVTMASDAVLFAPRSRPLLQ
jgi:23S rRNA (guanine745-N1)-methyltransferase